MFLCRRMGWWTKKLYLAISDLFLELIRIQLFFINHFNFKISILFSLPQSINSAKKKIFKKNFENFICKTNTRRCDDSSKWLFSEVSHSSLNAIVTRNIFKFFFIFNFQVTCFSLLLIFPLEYFLYLICYVGWFFQVFCKKVRYLFAMFSPSPFFYLICNGFKLVIWCIKVYLLIFFFLMYLLDRIICK